MKAIAILGVVGICALTPAAASAGITVPPGATEGDQYFEEAPNGGGGSSLDRHGGGSGGSQAVPATQALNALGPEGQAAADLANSNRPPQQGKANRSPQQGRSGNPNPSSQPSSSTQGEGGMGFLFPLLLVVTALAAVGYGLRRRLNPA